MTTAERKHRSLARRLAREYTAKQTVIGPTYRMLRVRIEIGQQVFNVFTGRDRGTVKWWRDGIALALATLVEREVERAMRKGRKV